jgi:hypothetical protein
VAGLTVSLPLGDSDHSALRGSTTRGLSGPLTADERSGAGLSYRSVTYPGSTTGLRGCTLPASGWARLPLGRGSVFTRLLSGTHARPWLCCLAPLRWLGLRLVAQQQPLYALWGSTALLFAVSPLALLAAKLELPPALLRYLMHGRSGLHPPTLHGLREPHVVEILGNRRLRRLFVSLRSSGSLVSA